MGIDIGLHGRVQVDADDNNLDTLKVLGVGKLGANKMAVRLVLQVNPRVSISMTRPNGDETCT